MFRKVGKIIKRKYERAIKIAMTRDLRGLETVDGARKKPSRSVLVFFEDSPDYCRLDSVTGEALCWRELLLGANLLAAHFLSFVCAALLFRPTAPR